jgi:integrase
MTGTIITREINDGTKRYDADWRGNDGKQHRKTFTRRKDAEKFLTATVKAVNDGLWFDVTPQPMTTVFDRWVSHSLDVRRKQGVLKPSTAKSYQSMLTTHLRPAFGEIRSDRFRAAVVADWAHTKADEIATGDMSPKFFNNLVNLLHVILGWARHPAQSYLAHDPMVGLKRLPRTGVERAFLEPDQIAALLEAADDVRDSTVLALAVYSGLRRGELFGLKWSDIDWCDGRIAVSRSLYQGELTTPKTKHSIRRVDVPASTLATLSIYRAHFPAPSGGFVFHTDDGTPLDPDNWHKRQLGPILAKADGVPPIGGLHALRHTYASLLINQGEALPYVSRQMGHATIAITVDLYGHLFKETGATAMRKLDARIGGTTGAKVVPMTGTHGR